MVGDRDTAAATEFMRDVARRLANRVQLATDGHRPYFQAVPDAFGESIDYARLVKIYGKPFGMKCRPDVPDVCIGCKKIPTIGNPDPANLHVIG